MVFPVHHLFYAPFQHASPVIEDRGEEFLDGSGQEAIDEEYEAEAYSNVQGHIIEHENFGCS